jgi:hypothetical protein
VHPRNRGAHHLAAAQTKERHVSTTQTLEAGRLCVTETKEALTSWRACWGRHR